MMMIMMMMTVIVPIAVTVLGIVTDTNDEQESKADEPIV